MPLTGRKRKRSRLAALATERSREFTVDRMRQGYAEIYNQVISRGVPRPERAAELAGAAAVQ